MSSWDETVQAIVHVGSPGWKSETMWSRTKLFRMPDSSSTVNRSSSAIGLIYASQSAFSLVLNITCRDFHSKWSLQFFAAALKRNKPVCMPWYDVSHLRMLTCSSNTVSPHIISLPFQWLLELSFALLLEVWPIKLSGLRRPSKIHVFHYNTIQCDAMRCNAMQCNMWLV